MNLCDYRPKLDAALGTDVIDAIKTRCEGTLSPADMWALYVFGRTVPRNGVICEIGSAWGASTAILALASGATVISIDPYTGETARGSAADLAQTAEEFGFADRHMHCDATSDAAAVLFPDESVDLVFIDGDHSQQQVTRDLANYWPKVTPGGWLVGHDYSKPHPSVRAAVEAWGHGPRVTLFVNSVVYYLQKGYV